MSVYWQFIRLLERFPYWLLALIARLSVALSLWQVPVGGAGISGSLVSWVLPLMLAAGLAARLSALTLLGLMIFLIMAADQPLLADILLRAVPLLLVLCFGPGAISLDRLIGLERRPGGA